MSQEILQVRIGLLEDSRPGHPQPFHRAVLRRQKLALHAALGLGSPFPRRASQNRTFLLCLDSALTPHQKGRRNPQQELILRI
jgi:hypothetical protein